MPSMSDSFSPASLMALSAASACSWSWDMLGMTPSSVVSAAPTTATAFLRMVSALCRTEDGKGERVVDRLECDFELHVEFERLRCLRAVDDVAHQPRAFVEFDHRDRIRRREAVRRRAVIDHVAVQEAFAGRLEDRDIPRGAFRAERPRW